MKIKATVDGQAPGMLFCNPRACNPMDEQAKILAGFRLQHKANRTEENLVPYLEAQWTCAMYWQEGVGCYIPRNMIQASLIQAAKKEPLKRGNYKEVAASSITTLGLSPLGIATSSGKAVDHKSKSDLDALRQNPEFFFVTPANINGSLVPIARPLFPKWAAVLQFEIFDPAAISPTLMKKFVENMGRQGFGDWRPSSKTPGEYGTFSIRKFETSENGKTWSTVE